jgi:hypothetical protein
MARYDTLFSLRYAVRVLERHARLWRRLDGLIRFSALLAGSGAFAALMAMHAGFAMAAGLVFAVLQAVEFTVRPAELSAKSLAARKGYADLLADQGRLSDDALAAAYERVSANDEVIVPEYLRRLAYNDVAEESGCGAEVMYPVKGWHRLLA